MRDDGMRPRRVDVEDLMQSGHSYVLTAPAGLGFDTRFQPQLTPADMLHLGVFGGRYMTDCRDEFPEEWFRGARLCHERHDPALNYFGINASLPLSVWRERGWLHPDDPRGWFQWYCRYWMGRRMPGEDDRQIARWRAFRRHAVQVSKNCMPADASCRPRQRQALMNWAYDSRRL